MVNKKRVWKRRKDGVRQRYHVGKKKRHGVRVYVKRETEHSGYFDDEDFEEGKRRRNKGYRFNPRTAGLERDDGW